MRYVPNAIYFYQMFARCLLCALPLIHQNGNNHSKPKNAMKKLLRFHFTLKGSTTITANANTRTDAVAAAKALEASTGMMLFDSFEMTDVLGDFDAVPAESVRAEFSGWGVCVMQQQIAKLKMLLEAHK